MISEKKFQRKLEKIKKRGERMRQEKELKDAYAEYLPDRKKKKVSNIMVAVSVIAIVAYTVANLVLQYCVGVEISPTITPYWFAFFGGELFVLAGIKITKTVRGEGATLEPEGIYDEETYG